MPENFREAIAASPLIFTIGVAGDSGSGKTTFTGTIRAILGEDLVSTITLDDYHTLDRLQRQERGITPLVPEANNLTLLAEHIAALKRGEEIRKPVYDHSTGCFGEPAIFRPTKVVIFEGLHPFATPELKALMDFTVFADPDEEVKYAWKLRRDMERRGYGHEEVLKEIRVRKPDYERYVAPQREEADAVIGIAPSVYERDGESLYSTTLSQRKLDRTLRNINLSFDLFAINSLADRDFLFEFRHTEMGGRPVGALTIDGEPPADLISSLERTLEEQTGACSPGMYAGRDYVTATEMTGLLLAWRIINRRVFMETS